jgi:hypothetical protein
LFILVQDYDNRCEDSAKTIPAVYETDKGGPLQKDDPSENAVPAEDFRPSRPRNTGTVFFKRTNLFKVGYHSILYLMVALFSTIGPIGYIL